MEGTPPEPRLGAAFTSLRAWVRHLADTGRCVLAKPGAGLAHDLAAVASRLDGDKAVLFPEPDGHAMPVVSGLVSQREWIAEALGTTQQDLLETFQAACENPLPWKEVTAAPVQQNVVRAEKGGEIDLLQALPLPTHAEHDSGPYITAGLLIARNPDTGIQNVSINRMQPNGPDRLGVLILPRHAHFYHEIAEKRGEDLPVAVAIGVDPATLLASQAILPVDHDELEVAGALLGSPLEVTKCVTNDVRVPASAEIVIEGRLLANTREPEGPFGEFPQYYGPRSDKPVIRIDAITHRDGALYHTILGGGLEHLLLGAIPREATILAHLRRSFVNVLDVALGRGGVMRYHAAVKIRARQRGEARNIAMATFGTHYDIKQVTVVDDDVDIHDSTEVEWAVATRFQAGSDLIVVTAAQGSKLDPSSDDGVSDKMALDATKLFPLETEKAQFRFTRIRVPGAEEVDLGERLEGDAAALAAILKSRS